jgi:predicted metalloprotease with PDZ domain
MKRIIAVALLIFIVSPAKGDKEKLPAPRVYVETLPAPRLYADFDLLPYKYPAQAKTATLQRGNEERPAVVQPPYLGVQLASDLRIAQVDSESPAAKNGLRSGDKVTSIDDKRLAGLDAFRDALMVRACAGVVAHDRER